MTIIPKETKHHRGLAQGHGPAVVAPQADFEWKAGDFSTALGKTQVGLERERKAGKKKSGVP